MRASREGQDAAVDYLLSMGADVNKTDRVCMLRSNHYLVARKRVTSRRTTSLHFMQRVTTIKFK
jgi:ankyrin repeat protein